MTHDLKLSHVLAVTHILFQGSRAEVLILNGQTNVYMYIYMYISVTADDQWLATYHKVSTS